MGSLKRKIARNKTKSAKKQMKEQLMMFDKLENECAMCQKTFDKSLEEHVTTWKVVVRKKEKIVRLYCPECWDKANKLIKEIQDDLRIRNERREYESTDESKS